MHKPSADFSALNPAISEPLSGTSVSLRVGSILHKQGARASLKAAAVLLSTLPAPESGFCARYNQLTKLFCPWKRRRGRLPSRQTRDLSAISCGRSPYQYAQGNPLPLPWLYLICVCGVGGGDANNANLSRQNVRRHRFSGDGLQASDMVWIL